MMKFVKIFDAQNEIDASVTRGYLESNGIKSVTQTGNSVKPSFFPNPNRANQIFGVFVHEEDETRAKQLLAERG